MKRRSSARPHDRAAAVPASSLVGAPSVRLFFSLETRSRFRGLQRVPRWAGQAPGQARWRELKVHRTTQGAFRHPFHDGCAEPVLLRRRHGRLLALGPTHGEGVTVCAPADIDTTPIVESAPYFPALVPSSWRASPIACAEAG